MKKYKFGLVGIILFGALLLGPSVSADYTYRVPSFAIAGNSWVSFHFYYSDGDMVIIQWFVVSTPESVDFMILNEANYSLFVDDLGFETFYLNNNSFEGHVIYQDIPEDLFFMVFTNDQSGGMSAGFQFSLIEADTNCTCTYTPDTSPSPATISGFVTLTFGLVTIVSIWLVIKRTKVNKI